MDERESDDKTEDPTEERRKQYREQGNIASPNEIVSAFSLLTFALLLPMMGENIFNALTRSVQRTWASFNPVTLRNFSFMHVILNAIEPLIPALLLISAIALIVPTTIGLTLTKFHWTVMSFKIEKVNPFSGLKRMFGFDPLIGLAKNLLKFIFVGSVVYFIIKKQVADTLSLDQSPIRFIASYLGSGFGQLCLSVGISTLFFGVSDFGWNWLKLERQMRMTKQEQKEESKSQDGDPQIKSRRRRMARDMLLRRSINEVQTATFIVTNPEHFAVAILYSKGMSAPRVIAKGQDFLAQKIKEIAKKSDIVTIENKPLARALYKTVKVGQDIPPSMYTSIIEVIKYIYQLRGKDYFDTRERST